MANYPGAYYTLRPRINFTHSVVDADVNELQDEIRAIQTTLGLNPHLPSATVAARLAALGDHALLTNLGVGDHHPHYLNNARHDVTARHGAAVVDHGSIGGIADDDHTQYFNTLRHTKAVHDALAIDHGTATGLGDDDHTQYLNNARHDVTTRHTVGTIVPAGTPGSSAPGDATAAGAATTVARADHKHGREAFGASAAETDFGAAKADGVATTLARSDHKHGTPAHTKAVHDALALTHNSLSGLTSGDPHTQYLTATRVAGWAPQRQQIINNRTNQPSLATTPNDTFIVDGSTSGRITVPAGWGEMLVEIIGHVTWRWVGAGGGAETTGTLEYTAWLEDEQAGGTVERFRRQFDIVQRHQPTANDIPSTFSFIADSASWDHQLLYVVASATSDYGIQPVDILIQAIKHRTG